MKGKFQLKVTFRFLLDTVYTGSLSVYITLKHTKKFSLGKVVFLEKHQIT